MDRQIIFPNPEYRIPEFEDVRKEKKATLIAWNKLETCFDDIEKHLVQVDLDVREYCEDRFINKYDLVRFELGYVSIFLFEFTQLHYQQKI